MKRFLLLFCFFVSVALFGQAPEFEWAIQQGGVGFDSGSAIATDSFGNVYTTGRFSNNSLLSDTADFDPSPNFYGLVSNGEADIFVSKVNPNGDLLWAVSFGDDENDSGRAITTDASGNVYITGSFRGAVDFDPGPDVYSLVPLSGNTNIFVLKLYTDGTFAWARQLGAGASGFGYSIAVDDAGNVYTTGAFFGTADFDPGIGIYNLPFNSDASYKADIFISCLDSLGNFVWAKAIGGESSDLGSSLALDSLSNIYVTGSFSDAIDFDPGPGEFTVVGDGDLFILKLNSNGDFIWVKDIDGALPEAYAVGQGITIGVEGNIHTTGIFFGTIDFDPGSASYELSATGKDIFILKLTSNGDFVWAKSVGGDDFQDCGNAIVLDEMDNVYIAGVFQGTVDFDPGSGTYNLFSNEGGGYVLKLDIDGSFIWAVPFSADNDNDLGEYNTVRGIALDKWNNIYTTGAFWHTTDFNPDSISYELTAYGITDIFIQKMRQQPCNTNPIISSYMSSSDFQTDEIVICPREGITLIAEMPSWIPNVAYSWSSGETTDSIMVMPNSTSIYTVTANYTYDTVTCILSNSIEVALFDSVEIVIVGDLEVCVGEVTSLEANGGTSYLWSTGDTTSLVTSITEDDQIYNVTVTDSNGCSNQDSVMVFVNPLPDTTYLLFTSCDSLEVGSSSFVLPDQNGCDSIITALTTLSLVPEAPIALADILIEENEPPFEITIAEVPFATEYFWTVPVGVQILSGGTTNSITIDWGMTTGGFICVNAINECGNSTTTCMEVDVEMIDGLNEIMRKSYSVFPNPADEVLNVVFEYNSIFEVTLLNVLGEVVKPSMSFLTQAQIETRELPVGTYWLKIKCLDCKKREVFFWESVMLVR